MSYSALAELPLAPYDHECVAFPLASYASAEPLVQLQLVERMRGGDRGARDEVIRHYRPLLMRWAHGRLPDDARDLNETADLVQTALMRALRHMDDFAPEGRGAFFGYLRAIVLNLLRDEIRRTARRPAFVGVPEGLEDGAGSPLCRAVTVETLAAYEQALQRMDVETRDAVIMRVELKLSHEEIAAICGCSTNAARMRVARALAKLAQTMRRHRD